MVQSARHNVIARSVPLSILGIRAVAHTHLDWPRRVLVDVDFKAHFRHITPLLDARVAAAVVVRSETYPLGCVGAESVVAPSLVLVLLVVCPRVL